MSASKPAYQNVDLSSINADLYLAERHAAHIVHLWGEAQAILKVERRKLPDKTQKKLERDNMKCRTEVLSWVMRATLHGTLAEQIADDFGLIDEAYWLGVAENPYINALVRAYSAGRLPMPEDFK